VKGHQGPLAKLIIPPLNRSGHLGNLPELVTAEGADHAVFSGVVEEGFGVVNRRHFGRDVMGVVATLRKKASTSFEAFFSGSFLSFPAISAF